MCGKRSVERDPATGPNEGGTVRLTDLPFADTSRCGRGFPWWVLWTIWPLIFLAKSAASLFTPLVGLLNQPIILTITPLPLLLIGAGLILLLAGAWRRSHE
jgi:hypothetical protein